MNGPNPISVAWSVLVARRKRRPEPTGTTGRVDHGQLGSVLGAIATDGVAALPGQRTPLMAYVDSLTRMDPDTLNRSGALAYWLNLYNAGALLLAGRAFSAGESSVLRLPGGFTDPVTQVAGEQLSLSDIEHGKIRRFKDPRIHAALVCGSVSCPTLRYEPYRGAELDAQLEDQMRAFLAAGGAYVEDGTRWLSRVFLWYGSDFVYPARMPTVLPATRRQVARALRPWLEPALQARRVAFQPYDWTLACSVSRPD